MASKLKFKANNWLDTKAHKVLYGIDVKMNGTWHHYGKHHNGFSTAAGFIACC